MEEERKKLEEIMVALSLTFMGKDGYKMQQAVAKKVRELDQKKN